MTNEELAAAIRQGETVRTAELWEQVRRWVYRMAHSWARRFDGKNGVCVDDLISSGFIAMVDAVQTYKPAEGAFTTWLTLYLKSAFLQAYGFRGSGSDALTRAFSLDAPIAAGEDTPLSETIPDPAAAEAIEAAEAEIDNRILRTALNNAMQALTDQQREALELRYYDGFTRQEISKRMHIDPEAVRLHESRALRTLRKPRIRRTLEPFIDFNPYHGTGLHSFLQSGTSVEEQYLLALERETERILHAGHTMSVLQERQSNRDYMRGLDG